MSHLCRTSVAPVSHCPQVYLNLLVLSFPAVHVKISELSDFPRSCLQRQFWVFLWILLFGFGLFSPWDWLMVHLGFICLWETVSLVKWAWCQKGFGKRSMRAQQLPRIPKKAHLFIINVSGMWLWDCTNSGFSPRNSLSGPERWHHQSSESSRCLGEHLWVKIYNFCHLFWH